MFDLGQLYKVSQFIGTNSHDSFCREVHAFYLLFVSSIIGPYPAPGGSIGLQPVPSVRRSVHPYVRHSICASGQNLSGR